LDYFGESEPAGETEADFFDFVPLPAGELLVAIGDVSKHGTGAAIIRSGLQAFLRGPSISEQPLTELAQGLNRSICDISPENFFATLFAARIDPLRRELRYVSAGHEPALLFHRKSGRLRRLERTGTVLGLTTRAVYQQRVVLIEPGDTLLAFTDGIIEAADARGRQFTEQGVRRVLEDYPEANARELSGCILEAVQTFRDRAAPADDGTVTVVRLVDRSMVRPLAEHAEELAVAAA